jgi:hypothetical protein
VILRYPPLCCGIVNEDKSEPAFIRLDSIDLLKCVEYKDISALIPSEYERDLEKILEHQHSQLWPDIHCRPGWRVVIVQSPVSARAEPVFEVIFAFHHALADGISGILFHRSMLEALNNPIETAKVTNHILHIPASISLSPPIEKSIKFKISWSFFLSELWREVKPRWLFPESSVPWTAAPCSAAHIRDYKSRVKILSIPSNLVPKILSVCREQNVTLTGFLHGLIVVSLATRVPTATSFTSETPFSLRHLTGKPQGDEMGVYVSALFARYSSDLILGIRGVQSDPVKEMEHIWALAREFQEAKLAELSRLPNDNFIGLLPYVKNLHRMFSSRIGKARGVTYTMSNIGTLRAEGEGNSWKIERVVFSQSGMGTGPAMAFNVASVTGGPLVVSVTWLEGVDENLIDALVKDVENGVRSIS